MPADSRAAKLAEIISDDEIIRVHGHANFGDMSPREVVNDGVRKYAVGYSSGHTQLCILLEHGLIHKPRPGRYDANLTKKGKRYARVLFADAFASASPARGERDAPFTVDELAQEIRRVDGNHSLGAGALAEALMPFLSRPSPGEGDAPASIVIDDATRDAALRSGKKLNDWITGALHKAAEMHTHPTPATPEGLREKAWADVRAERLRQVEAEGWSTSHDDEHGGGEMAKAAACYAAGQIVCAIPTEISPDRGAAGYRSIWPWDMKWWKPKTYRRNLVRAAALLIAEIERLDRRAALQPQGGGGE